MSFGWREQARLYDELVSCGWLTPQWRPAYWRAPRHRFVPDTVWRWSDGSGERVSRHDDPQRWLGFAYGNEVVAIQYDDGTGQAGQPGRRISSSVSKPDLVFTMLRHLDVRPGQRVMEVGTGSGWNAGLLAARLGSDAVTTVEIDAPLADAAGAALGAVDLHPTVVAGDGELGYPAHAPYDRIVSTAAVRRVPYAWVEQTRPGGLIVAPWGTSYDNGALLVLTAQPDGTARGRFVFDDLSFMWVRGQRPSRAFDGDDERADTETVTDVPWDAVRYSLASFAIGVRVPDCRGVLEHHPDPGDDHYEGWLLDDASGSWAQVRLNGHSPLPVRQGGPRRLWDEVEMAYRWWEAVGRPGANDFDVVVTPAGQYVLHQGQLIVTDEAAVRP